jgi:hypothetical protein
LGTTKEEMDQWIYVPNWEEHKREAIRKFEEFAESPGSGQNLAPWAPIRTVKITVLVPSQKFREE